MRTGELKLTPSAVVGGRVIQPTEEEEADGDPLDAD